MKPLLLAVTALLLSSSCYTVVHDYDGEREVTPGTRLSQPSVKVGEAEARKKAHFLFWGLVDLNDASAPRELEDAAVAEFSQDFDGLTRVRIHEEQEAIDVIVQILTLGIFSMVTVEAQADVHRLGEEQP